MTRNWYLLFVASIGLLAVGGCRDGDTGRQRVILGANPGQAGTDDVQETSNGMSVSGGVYQRTLMRENGPPIRYTMRVPYSYDEEESLPLLIILHYSGDVKPFFGEQILMGLYRQSFRFLPCILVAPDSLNGPWTTKENEQAVLDLLDHLIQDFKVDQRKIVLTGFSMGGHGSWAIGGRHQDRFSALIPIAGRPDESIDQWSIPVFAIHSRADEVVPIEPTIEYVRKMQKKGYDVNLYPLRRPTHHAVEAYILPLRSMTHWLRKVWGEQDPSSVAADSAANDRAEASSR